jgi:hypothetical protein
VPSFGDPAARLLVLVLVLVLVLGLAPAARLG